MLRSYKRTPFTTAASSLSITLCHTGSQRPQPATQLLKKTAHRPRLGVVLLLLYSECSKIKWLPSAHSSRVGQWAIQQPLHYTQYIKEWWQWVSELIKAGGARCTHQLLLYTLNQHYSSLKSGQAHHRSRSQVAPANPWEPVKLPQY